MIDRRLEHLERAIQTKDKRIWIAHQYEDSELFQTRECGSNNDARRLSKSEIDHLPGLVIVVRHVSLTGSST